MLVLAAFTLIAAMLINHQSALAGSAQPLATDTFSRTVVGGWGSAEVGGAYTLGGSAASSFAVNGQSGRMVLLTNGAGPTATLRSVSSSGIDLSTAVQVDKAATGSGIYVYVIGRFVPGVGQYFAKVRLVPGGAVSLALGKRNASFVESAILPAVQVPGLTAVPGASLRVRVQVTGTNPTTIRARVWKASAAEPSTWTRIAQDSAAGLQVAGSVGVSSFLSGSATNAPVVVSVDSLSASSIAATAPAPPTAVAPTTPTAPVSTAPVSTAPAPAPTAPAPAPAPTAPQAGRASASAGSAAVGSTSYAVPAAAVFVSPGGSDAGDGSVGRPFASVAKAVSVVASGGTVVLRGGTYHQSVTLPAGKQVTVQSFPGEAVWFDGSSVVTPVASGGHWVVDGWMPVFDHSPTYTAGAPDGTSAAWSFVNAAYPMASYPDQVWVGSSALRQVGSLAAVVAGTFFVDTAAHRLYLGSDPGGQQVRSSDLQVALTVSSSGSVLRGFGVRRYATSMPLMGTVRVRAPGVTLENVVVADNATQGISVAAVNTTLRRVTSVRNGLMGVHADYADGLKVVGLRSSNNNTEHFNMAPASGGVKITRSRNLSITDSAFESNRGPGVWLDMSDYNVTFTRDDFVSNVGKGLFLEISDTVVVADNVFTDNGETGVTVDNTGHVAVWNNTFARNSRDLNIVQDRRSQLNPSDYGHDLRQPQPDMTVPWLSQHVNIHNNIFDNSTGNATFAVEDYTHTNTAEAMNIATGNNVYLRANTSAPGWLIIWSAGSGNNGNPYVYTSLAAFKAAKGQDLASVSADGGAPVPSPSPAALPVTIANLIGQPAGNQHMGAY